MAAKQNPGNISALAFWSCPYCGIPTMTLAAFHGEKILALPKKPIAASPVADGQQIFAPARTLWDQVRAQTPGVS